MVAEPVTEIAEGAPVDASLLTATQDTPESVSPPADLAPSSTEAQEPSPDEVINNYLSTAGLTESSETTETVAEEVVDPEVEARAQRIAAERLQAEARARDEAGVQMAYREAMPWTENFLSQYLNRPLDLQAIRTVLNTMNGLNSQSKQVVQKEATLGFVENQYKEADKLFPKFSESRKDHKSTADFYNGLISKAREGYVTPKQSEAAVKKAILDEHQRLQSNPAVLRAMLSKASAPQTNTSTNNGSRSSVPTTTEEALSMPIADIKRLRDQGQI